MATQNRGQRITKLLSQVKKQYKPVPPPSSQRTLLEHLLFASLLENSPHDAAEKVFAELQVSYCGWNEVRVSTRRELSEVMKPLVDPGEAAERLKRTLHNVFETVYEFDLEPLKKQNLGAAVKQLEAFVGTTPFMISYVVQHSLGGHSIPVNKGLLVALEALEVITPAEAAKHQVPGLERTVPKSKGPEVASMLHQLGVEIGKNPYGASARKALLAIDASCKDNLPKKPVAPEPEPVIESAPEPAPAKASPKKSAATKSKPAADPPAADPPAKSPAKKKAVSEPAKPVTKKAAAKKAPSKPEASGDKKKAKTKTAKKLTKKKPK
jgi:endonuclease-3